ncbi:hypothetical protein WJX82_003835 [Trebouxia sp. C0006]
MDSGVPEKVAAHVPESSPHTQLQEYERRTDACLLQKRSEVQDALRCLHRVAKLLRLFVCSSHANQEASARSSGPGGPGRSMQSQRMAKMSPINPSLQLQFSLLVLYAPSPAQVAGQIASKPPVSAADLLLAAGRKSLMDHKLPEKVAAFVPGLCHIFRGSREVNPEPEDGKDVTSQPQPPEKVAAYVPESALYTQLQKPLPHLQSRLLGPLSFRTSSSSPRLQTPLDTPHPPPPPNPPLYQPPSQSFTHYIRRLTAQLDSEQYSDGEEHVAWEKGRHVRNHKDSFEVRQQGDQHVEVVRSVDNQPDWFTVRSGPSDAAAVWVMQNAQQGPP